MAPGYQCPDGLRAAGNPGAGVYGPLKAVVVRWLWHKHAASDAGVTDKRGCPEFDAIAAQFTKARDARAKWLEEAASKSAASSGDAASAPLTAGVVVACAPHPDAEPAKPGRGRGGRGKGKGKLP